jgi:hypothetical protein
MLLQKSISSKHVSENSQMGKQFDVGWHGHNREGSLALEIIILLFSSLVNPI